ncbi:MAG: AMP-binding protein, partial [bacterium]|nr:AMP-binding protein [bacterium]
GLIGFFVNTLVLRTDLTPDPSFHDLLSQVRQVALDGYAHQNLPFERLVEELQPQRDLSTTPLFQVMFVLQNAPRETLDLPGLTLSPVATQGAGTAKFELTLSLVESAAGIVGGIEYQTDLFDPTTIERFLARFERLLRGAVDNPEARLSELPWLTQAERHQLLAAWNDTASAGAELFPELFERRVERSPEAVAVTFEDHRLSYRELDRRARRLARTLETLGVGPEVPVGLCIERSPEMVVGILGILAAGGAWLPLDPRYPRERLAFMVEDAGLPVILTQERLVDALPEHAARVLCLDSAREGWPETSMGWQGQTTPAVTRTTSRSVKMPQASGVKKFALVCPDQAAYLIYTSGSTGRPKGVVVPHRGLGNLATAQIELFGLRPGDRVLQFSSLNFDASVWEIAMALSVGATLCLAPPERLLPGSPLRELLDERRITCVTLPPSALAVLETRPGKARASVLVAASSGISGPHQRPDELPQALPLPPLGKGVKGVPAKPLGPNELPALATLVVAGEACSPELAWQWSAGRRFFNAYGPTETTVCATAGRYLGGPRLPMGTPIANNGVVVLDRHQRIVGIGVVGELAIGGLSVARGYLGRPALTAERFVPDPFAGDPGGARRYRTGDLGRSLVDGTIEFLGRIDHQVKLRGFRIELGEIETVLVGHPAVAEAMVLVREISHGEQGLVAFLVPGERAAAGPLDVESLRGFLKEKLPDYMVPSVFVELSELPVTPHGKVDRAALGRQALPDRSRSDPAALEAPRTPAEEMLAGIWSQSLGMTGPTSRPIGVGENFFELGGHSLLATRVISRVREAFGVEIPVRQLFETPTVAGLAEIVEKTRGEGRALAVPTLLPIPRVGGLPREPVPLSFAQERLWFLDQLDPGSSTYNMPTAFRLAGRLDIPVLLASLREIVRRHEVLRTTFTRGDDGSPV